MRPFTRLSPIEAKEKWMSPEVRSAPKHQHIYETVRERIVRGAFRPGERMPPDADLVKEFGCSRPTVAKALQELERDGFVRRRSGSGTFVLNIGGQGKNFGMLIPGFGECEIFEPISSELAHLSQELGHGLLWGATRFGSEEEKERLCLELCEQYIREKVDGVFFAPLELTPNKDSVNRQIVSDLAGSNIPVVLIDRDYVPFPERSPYDLVGVDNRRVGYLLTDLLFRRRCRRVVFISRPGSASTIDGRIAGFMEAVVKFNGKFDSELVHRFDPRDERYLARVLQKHKPDGIVCVNDMTAGILMHSLANLDVRVPDDVLVAGIDDVKYAELLRVPLTSVRQPCRAIGDAAFHAMLHRSQFPDTPPRDILLACEIVERKSTAAMSSKEAK
jgi:GntR family transcriptional regulator, arabinose operon transcriptional repressor